MKPSVLFESLAGGLFQGFDYLLFSLKFAVYIDRTLST